VNKPFIDTRLEIRSVTEISGWGVFSREHIHAGEIIEISTVVVYPRKLMEVAIWACQAEGISDADLKLDQYSINWQAHGAVMLGWASIYNHSDNPNVKFIADYDLNLIGIQAIRNIDANSQILVSYGEHWFNQKPYVKKIEF
jgi:SET domain-containing protein